MGEWQVKKEEVGPGGLELNSKLRYASGPYTFFKNQVCKICVTEKGGRGQNEDDRL